MPLPLAISESLIIPNGNDMILENDNVIVVTTNHFLDDLNEIME